MFQGPTAAGGSAWSEPGAADRGRIGRRPSQGSTAAGPGKGRTVRPAHAGTGGAPRPERGG